MEGGTLLGPMVSHHFDRDTKYNERHLGAGYRSEGGLLGGFYKNSLGKPSFYAGKNWSMPLLGPIGVGLTAGGVTGYPAGKVLPMLVPELTFKIGDQTVALMLQPPVGKKNVGALALQFRGDIK